MLFNMLKRHPDSPAVVVHPPILLGAAFLIGLALDYWFGTTFGLGEAIKLGYVLLAGGFALSAWSVWHLRAAETNVPTNLPTTALVSTGPYRNSRNPIYIGLAVAYLGLASIMDAPLAMLLMLPALLLLHVGVVLREEAYLEAKFGDAYKEYAARTKRYF